MTDNSTRRAMILGLIGSFPGAHLARAAAPVTVAPPLLPKLRTSPLAVATTDLLDALSARQDTVKVLRGIDVAQEVAAARSKSPEIAAAGQEGLRQIRASLDQVESQTQKIERLCTTMSEFPASELAAGAGDLAECARLNRLLFESGYLDSAQMAAITRGKFQWNSDEIAASLARGRAAASRLTAPIATQLPAAKGLL